MKKIYIKSLLFLVTFGVIGAIQAQEVQYFMKLEVDDPTIDWTIDAIQANFGPAVNGVFTSPTVFATDGITEPTDADSISTVGQYCCEALTNASDVDGKIAFISRGACEFGVKLFNAETAGATAGIVGNRAPIGRDVGTHTQGLVWMGGGVLGDTVTIPGAFITYEDRRMVGEILETSTPNMTYLQNYMYDATFGYAKTTPMEAIVPFENITVIVTNLDTVDWLDVTFNCEITSPSGAVTMLTETADTVFAAVNIGISSGANTSGENEVTFDEGFTPTEMGEYTAVFTTDVGDATHPISSETITMKVSVTDENMFALDNGNIVNPRGMAMEFQAYIDNGGQAGTGSIYRTGDTEVMAGGISFALANPGQLFPEDQLIVKIFRGDGDSDGTLDNDASGAVDILDFPPSQVLVAGAYVITGNEAANEILTVAFDTPTMLPANSLYLVTVETPGFAVNQSPNPPAWSTAGGMNFPNFGTVYRFGNDAEGTFEVDGWEEWNNVDAVLPGFPHGGPHTVVRLLTGEVVGTQDLLSESQFNVYPTLAKDFVQVDLNLNNTSQVVKLNVTDVSGKLMATQMEKNVSASTFTFDTSSYPAGTYFLNIDTRDGMNTKKFVVSK